jgi:hypothetical protein
VAGQVASEIRIGANGTIRVAPSGTAGPANITAAWTGFTDIGFADEEGVKLTRNMETNQIKAWQSISTLRYVITGVDLQVAFNLLQWDKDTLPFYMGGGTVIAQGGGSFKYVISSAPTIDERVLGVEWTDGALTYRLVVGRGMVTETSETNVQRSDAIKLPLTFSAMTPATGVELAYILTNDTAFA